MAFQGINEVTTSNNNLEKTHASTPRYQVLLCTVQYSIYVVRESSGLVLA